MRTNDILLDGFDNIQILYQYLYMSEEHSVTVNNGLADLVITMTENCYFQCKNMNFPHLPLMNYTEEMTIPKMLGIIDYLNSVPAIEFPNTFSSRWDEIKHITLSNVSQNRMKKKYYEEREYASRVFRPNTSAQDSEL